MLVVGVSFCDWLVAWRLRDCLLPHQWCISTADLSRAVAHGKACYIAPAMALLTPMSLSEAQHIGAGFDLDVVAVEALAAGSVNSNFRIALRAGGQVFFRVCEESDHAAVVEQNALLAQLVARGVPTPAPHARLDGAGSVARHRGKPVVVFDFCAGRSCAQDEVDPARARAVGASLARIHAAGAGFATAPPNRFDFGALQTRIEQLQRAELAPGIAADVTLLAARVEHLRSCRPLQRRGVIHGDLFRDNVLWHPSGELSAVLDFESASEGSIAFDLMVTMHAWCFADTLDLELVAGLVSGYRSHAPLDDQDLIDCFVAARSAAVRFAITRISDYELRSGEVVLYKDYRRFMARLRAVEALGVEGLAEALR
jgi:homoserine kinase type II